MGLRGCFLKRIWFDWHGLEIRYLNKVNLTTLSFPTWIAFVLPKTTIKEKPL